MGTGDVLVLTHGSVAVDSAYLERFGSEWGSAWGVTVESAVFEDSIDLAKRLEVAFKSGSGVVISPGNNYDFLKIPAIDGDASRPPVVALDLARLDYARPINWAANCDWAIRGLAVDGYRWAARKASTDARWPRFTLAYDSGEDQASDLRLPEMSGPTGTSVPVCIVIHGGDWKPLYRRDLMDGLCVDLARRGVASWNVGYRRVGQNDAMWPEVSGDVVDAIRAIRNVPQVEYLDLENVTVLGHSAGGQLAFWITASQLEHDLGVKITTAVSLAGVADMVSSGWRAATAVDLMGGSPEEVPERYADASPMLRLPFESRQVIIQGLRDKSDLIDMNRRYAAAGRRCGCPVELIELEGADHFDVITESTNAWSTTCKALGW